MLSFKKYYKKIAAALTFRRSSKRSDRHGKESKKALSSLIKKTIQPPEKARPQSRIVGIPEDLQQVEKTQPANKELKQPKTCQTEGTSQLDKASQLESARKEAQSQILLSPTVAKWYIHLAEIYRQENNLLAALKAYKQGFASVPSDDAQHSHLQKEMQAVSATLTRLNLQLSSIPYEIWQLIVQFLDLKDLRQCAGASALWSNMLLELPWEAFFLSRVRTDKANDPSELTIHCGTGCSREITLKEIFMILSHWKSNTFQMLKFAGYRLEQYGQDVAEEQRQMFSTIETPFNLVTFDRTVFYTDEFMPVLESCARVEHILFIDIKLDYSDRHFTRLGTELPYLTFLELSFSDTQLRYWRNQADALIDSMSPMFRLCPNLRHFILDNGIPSLQAYCTREVLDHCPRIQTLSITVRLRNNVAELVGDYIKKTVSTDGAALSNELTQTTKDGLRFFIHRPTTDEHGYSISATVFDESYSSLEHIELFYDGCNVNTYGLCTLACHGAPCLREIHFSLFGYDITTHTGPPIDQVLIDLFSRCPSLEVIRIRLSGKNFTNTPSRNAELLMTIAKSCPLLRQLLFRVFSYHFDVKTMLDFAAAVGPKLEYLFISMDTSAALAVVQKIPTLVHFSASSYVGELFNGSIGQANPERMSQARKTIERILNNRIDNSQTDTRIFSRYY